MMQLVDIQFTAAMGPPGGGRNHVTFRFLRHFSVISVLDFTPESISRIFSSLVEVWMRKCNYPSDVQRLKTPMVEATIDIYKTVQRELLPTPAKSHYTYNLRDISKVFLGLQGAPARCDNYQKIVRIWTHENLRVFHDRLIDDDDRSWFCNLIPGILDKHFKEKYVRLFSHLSEGKADPAPAALKDYFVGNYMVPGADPKIYDEVEGRARTRGWRAELRGTAVIVNLLL